MEIAILLGILAFVLGFLIGHYDEEPRKPYICTQYGIKDDF